MGDRENAKEAMEKFFNQFGEIDEHTIIVLEEIFEAIIKPRGKDGNIRSMASKQK